MKYRMNLMVVLGVFCFGAAVNATASQEGAGPYFIAPQNGATVTSPVTVVMGLRGMGIAPAGTAVENTGHHHLIIDAPLPNLNQPIPNDDHYRHFGGGQTQAQIELPPGTHSLQLLLGDFAHFPHDPALFSEVITITVQ